jgi:hypothetical protein
MAYPNTWDTFTTKNAGDTIMNTHVNALQTSVVAIEEKLGSGTPLTASTNTALLGTGASSTGYQVISLANASLVQGTLTAERGGTAATSATNTAGGVVILDASSKVPVGQLGAAVDCSAEAAHDNELAATDGFVIVTLTHDGTTSSRDISIGYTDAASPPTTIRGQCTVARYLTDAGYPKYQSFCMPVKKNDRWTVLQTGNTATEVVYWIPWGA